MSKVIEFVVATTISIGICILALWIAAALSGPIRVEAKKRITPDYRLEVRNNKVIDTVFIYENPKQ